MASQNFEQVLQNKYPAKHHAQRTVERMRDDGVDTDGVIYLESAVNKLQLDNDFPEHFRYVIKLVYYIRSF